MRIISGTHRGRQINPDKRFTARPTTDFAKENIFNVITNRMDLEGIRVLDLFSGTGSISYEFASRGASEIISVELKHDHYLFIKKTAEQLGFNNIKVFKNNAFDAVRRLKGQQFDIVFADPPYQLEKIDDIPDSIFKNDLLKPEGLAILEHPKTVDYSSHPFFLEKRVYGSVNFSIFVPSLISS